MNISWEDAPYLSWKKCKRHSIPSTLEIFEMSCHNDSKVKFCHSEPLHCIKTHQHMNSTKMDLCLNARLKFCI